MASELQQAALENGTAAAPHAGPHADATARTCAACWRQPTPSRRVRATDSPVIAKSKAIIAASGRTDVASLAQGVVHWPPPAAALAAAAAATAAAAADPAGAAAAALHSYGPTPGLPPLRAALRRALAAAGLAGYEPVVTPGANAAFTITLLTIADADDAVALFAPTYFNHRMAVQMTGGAAALVTGPLRPDLRPDLDWLEAVLQRSGGGGSARPPRVVVLCNPNNPTGVLLAREELDRAAALTGAAGAWLVIDNTYGQFVYEGRQHYCPAGPHIIHLFSLSKAYGMMGWRVGYIALPRPTVGAAAGLTVRPGGPAAAPPPPRVKARDTEAARRVAEDLGEEGFDLLAQVLKCQDDIPICTAQASQIVALAALEGGAAAAAALPGVLPAADGAGSGSGDGAGAGSGKGTGQREEAGAGLAALHGAAYVAARVQELEGTNRETVRRALTDALGASAVRGGEGGIYFFCRLPAPVAARDEDAVRWLVERAGVCVLPGSSCQAPGWLRVAFANLPPAACGAAAARLGAGLAELRARGAAALDEDLS